jgi:hypothetical protein
VGKFGLTLFGLILGIACPIPGNAQQARLREAPPLSFPSQTDSNSPAFWQSDNLILFNSTGDGPIRSSGASQSQFDQSEPVILGYSSHRPYWIEATWVDSDDTVFAWYHHEPAGLCGQPSRLTAPKIGALVSYDGGESFRDLGIILETGYPIDCAAQNGYFAGGHGDFTVALSRDENYFYFLFSNYSGPLESQGVVLARLPFARRYNPVFAVEKWFEGGWNEPGLGGRVSAIFPARTTWSSAAADALWGPSVHYNRYLDKFVMLLNHSCCGAGWPQEGVYISYNSMLSNPSGWSEPVKLIDNVWWYPQVLGYGPNGSDKVARRIARFWVYGKSEWEIVFDRDSGAQE